MKDAAVYESENMKNSPDSGLSNTFRALRHRNFQLFFAGQFMPLNETWMQMVGGVPASKGSFQTPTLTSEREVLPKT